MLSERQLALAAMSICDPLHTLICMQLGHIGLLYEAYRQPTAQNVRQQNGWA